MINMDPVDLYCTGATSCFVKVRILDERKKAHRVENTFFQHLMKEELFNKIYGFDSSVDQGMLNIFLFSTLTYCQTTVAIQAVVTARKSELKIPYPDLQATVITHRRMETEVQRTVTEVPATVVEAQDTDRGPVGMNTACAMSTAATEVDE